MKYFRLHFILIAALTGTMAYHFESEAHSITPDVRSCLNLRQEPNGRKITCLRSGVHLDVIRTSGNWLQVRYNDKVGWVYGYNNRYIKTIDEPSTAVAAPASDSSGTSESEGSASDLVTAKVPFRLSPVGGGTEVANDEEPAPLEATISTMNTTEVDDSVANVDTSEIRANTILTPQVQDSSCLRLRSEPGLTAGVQSCLRNSAGMRATGRRNGTWLEVETQRGKGWVHAGFTEPASSASPRETPSGEGAEMWRTNPSGTVTCSRNDTNPVKCMACNAHFEAGNQRIEGRQAVHYVVFNRVQAPRWPNDICQVVWQRHQFSWTTDRRSNTMPKRNFEARQEEALAAMNEFLSGTLDSSNIAACSEHYVNPSIASRSSLRWRRRLTNLGRIGGHEFYRYPNHRCFDGTGAGYDRLARAAGVPADSGRELPQTRPLARQTPQSTLAVQ